MWLKHVLQREQGGLRDGFSTLKRVDVIEADPPHIVAVSAEEFQYPQTGRCDWSINARALYVETP